MQTRRFALKGYQTIDTGLGLTLVELIIAVAILAVVLLVAVPTLSAVSNKIKMQTGTYRLAHSLALARSEAIHRNEFVSVCPIDSSRKVVDRCEGGYKLGWMVYTNRNRDRVLDPGQDQLLGVYEGFEDHFSVSNRAGTRTADELLTYYPDGTARRNLTFLVCARNSTEIGNMAVIVNNVGRVRTARNEGNCP